MDESNTYFYDDGSSMTTYADGRVSATPWEAQEMVQGASGSSATGFMNVLDQFTGLITKGAGAIVGIQSQADAYKRLQVARDLEAYKTNTLAGIGRANLDIAGINAQRDLAIAKNNATIKGTFGMQEIMLLAVLGGGVMMMAAK